MTQQPQPQQSLETHLEQQKQIITAKTKELADVMINITQSWYHNFVINDNVKNQRVNQVNTLLQFINQVANEGSLELNKIGQEVTDPLLSNRILECNNTLMTTARSVLENIQNTEAQFQQNLSKYIESVQSKQPKTEVVAKDEM